MTDLPVDTRSDRFRKAMAAADECGLRRGERIDLAEFLLRRDVRSWKELTEAELNRLLDALEGWRLICYLIISGRRDVSDRISAEPVSVDRLQ